MYTELFEYKGSFYKINKEKYETREHHMERVWFILNKLDTCNESNELIRLSIIMSNSKKYGCSFGNALSNKIKN